jgi:hypothetical protein
VSLTRNINRETLIITEKKQPFQIKIQETLSKFSLFEFGFSPHKPQRSLHILDPHASLIKNHPSFGAILQEIEQFMRILMAIGFGN